MKISSIGDRNLNMNKEQMRVRGIERWEGWSENNHSLGCQSGGDPSDNKVMAPGVAIRIDG